MTFINPIYNTCNIYTPAFKAKGESNSAPVSNPIPQPNISFRCIEALAAYNYNIVNKNKDFDSIPTIKPIEIPEKLEEIDGKKVTYSYLANGELRNVFYDDVVIECNGEWGYVIYENLEDGAKKETSYYDSGRCYVFYSKGEIEKSISYLNSKVTDYNKSIDGKGYSYEFDQDGNIKDVMETEFIRD